MHDRPPFWAPTLLAVQFLTRIPVPGTAALTAGQVATGLVRAVAWFPLVGAGIGTITGAVALAAILSGKIETRGQTIVAVLSGGNVDPAMFAACIQDG